MGVSSYPEFLRRYDLLILAFDEDQTFMQPKWHTKDPFRFHSCLHLFELTGREARNLKELVKHLREVDDSVIFNHTHNFLIRHHYLTPQPPSAFTHWVKEALKEEWLGEQLEGINTIEFTSLKDLREKIINTIEAYIKKIEGLVSPRKVRNSFFSAP